MYVCICKAVTEREIRNAIADGACTVRALRKELGCTGQCGRCKSQVREIVDEATAGECEAGIPSLAAT